LLPRKNFFKIFDDSNSFSTWLWRIIWTFFMVWAFECLLEPLEVAADLIPFIGPCLGESVSMLTKTVSCCCGVVCSLGVIGVMWTAMRPMLLIPLVIVLCGGGIFLAYTVVNRKPKGKKGQNDYTKNAGLAQPTSAMEPGMQMIQPGMQPMMQPMMQPGGGEPMMQPGMMQPGMMQPGMMQPGMMQPGMMQPGMTQPGMMQPGMMQPGMMQPGMMQPGMQPMMQPGMMQPGMMQPMPMQQGMYDPNMQMQMQQQQMYGGYQQQA